MLGLAVVGATLALSGAPGLVARAGTAPSLHAPPSSLEASWLLRGASLSRALGTAVSGLEDEGGTMVTFGAPGEFESQAVTATSSDQFQVAMDSFRGASAAAASYRSTVAQLGDALALTGIGEKASIETNELFSECEGTLEEAKQELCHLLLEREGTEIVAGEVAVLKGSQVLTITPTLTAAGKAALVQDQPPAGSTSGSVQALLGLYQADDVTQPEAMARALAARLTGRSASQQYLEIPKGGMNPCGYSDSVVGSKLKASHVTSQNVPSDAPPALACDYSTSLGLFQLDTVSDYQLAHAVPAMTLASWFTSQAGSGGAWYAGADTAMGGVGGEDFTIVAAEAGDTQKTGFGVLMESTSSGSMPDPYKLCSEELQWFMRAALPQENGDYVHVDTGQGSGLFLFPKHWAEYIAQRCYYIATDGQDEPQPIPETYWGPLPDPSGGPSGW